VLPVELGEAALAAVGEAGEGAEAVFESVAGEAEGGEVGVLEEGALKLHLAEEVEEVGEGLVFDGGQAEGAGIALAAHEAGGVGGAEQLAGELDAGGHGPAAGALVAHPGDDGVAVDGGWVAGAALYEVLAGEGAVEGVAELEVPVTDEGAGVGGGGLPALQRAEGAGVGVVAAAQGGEELGDAGEAAIAEPPALKGGERVGAAPGVVCCQ
jgi:hypothetical protein